MNLKLLLLLLLTGVFFVACEEEEEKDDEKNIITYDGLSYTMKDGVLEDYGSGSPHVENTHYNYNVVIADAPLKLITGNDGETHWRFGDGSTFGIDIELYSPGTNSFNTGTFNYLDWYDDGLTQADFDGKYFFADGSVFFISGNTQSVYLVTSGTIKVSGSSLDYSIEFDLIINNGKAIKGNYSGSFKYDDKTHSD